MLETYENWLEFFLLVTFAFLFAYGKEIILWIAVLLY